MPEEKFLNRVKNLLDKANATEFPKERKALLDKADELMMKHGIEEAMLMALMSKDERRKPVVDLFHAADPTAPHWEKFRTVIRALGKLQRLRVVFYSNGDAHLIGFHEDVEYVKMKWLNVYLHFSKTIDPNWDRNITPEHNVYNFKVAGRSWQDIQYAAACNGLDKPMHWFKPAYQRHCRYIGEEPTRHTQRNFAYRESFAEAFRTRLCSRVEEMIEKRDGMASEAGALVAVRDLMTEVDEEFYKLFPNRRPLTPEQQAEQEARIAAMEKEIEEKHLKWLESLSPAQRREYDRKQEEEQREADKRNRQYWRDWEREQNAKHDSAGMANGAKSADKIDLNKTESVDNASRKEL